MLKFKNRKGFTLVEIIIVLSLTGLLVLISYPVWGQNIRSAQLKNNTIALVDTLRSAQAKAMFRKGNSRWGVHLESNKFILFKGSSYNPADPDNIETILPSYIVISSSLNGGGVDIIFNKVLGNTNNFGTITLTDNGTANTKSVIINQEGMIDYN